MICLRAIQIWSCLRCINLSGIFRNFAIISYIYFQSHLTHSQLQSANREKERRDQLKSDEILRRFHDEFKLQHPHQRKTSPVLRIRVVDAKIPTKTALLSIWNPFEDLQNLVKTGNFIEVSCATVSKYCYDAELSMNTSNKTSVKVKKISIDLEKFKPFLRVLTSFSAVQKTTFAPLNNEFDIICLVINVGVKQGNLYVLNLTCIFLLLNF